MGDFPRLAHPKPAPMPERHPKRRTRIDSPRVWNKRGAYPHDAIYVGRPTVWGNPFRVGPMTQEEAVARYAAWILSQPDLIRHAQRVLRGKHLLCWCAPLSCHADVLLQLANEKIQLR